VNGLQAAALYGCTHAAPSSCPWCSGDAADDRERPRGWRFEEPRRLSDAEWGRWLLVLHAQSTAEPLRRTP
jgi:hypothetical protein